MLLPSNYGWGRQCRCQLSLPQMKFIKRRHWVPRTGVYVGRAGRCFMVLEIDIAITIKWSRCAFLNSIQPKVN